MLVAGGAPTQLGSPDGSAEAYDPGSDTWQPRAAMAIARKLHSATPVTGGKVLVAGGRDGAGALASAEVYDPGAGAAGAWSATAAPLSAARFGHSATPVAGGKVLLAGGTGAGGAALSSAELYDPATSSFGAVAGGLATARAGHTATPLASGKVLLAGGTGAGGAPLASAELYDPSTGSFAAVPGGLAVARSGHSATPLGDGRVLLAGGSGTDGAPLASTELYDPATGAFGAAAGGLSVARSGHSATVLADGRVLLAGGRGAENRTLASTEVHDPASGASETGSFASLPFGSAVPFARAGHTATPLTAGRVLVVGGTTEASAEAYDAGVPPFRRSGPRLGRAGTAVLLGGPACRGATLASWCGKLLAAGEGRVAELYDPVGQSWSGCLPSEAGCGSSAKPGALAFERTGATLTLLDGSPCRSSTPPAHCGRVLLVGGTSGGGVAGEPYARVELYDPGSGTWSSCDSAASASASCPAPYPGGAVRDHTATLLADGRVVVAGGSGGAVTIDGSRRDFYIYDPASGRWSAPGELANVRRNHRAALLEGGSAKCADHCGKVLLVGGQGTAGVDQTAELLDPAAVPFPVSVATPQLVDRRSSGHSATLLESGRVLVAGPDYPPEHFDPKVGTTGGWGAAPGKLRAKRGAEHTAAPLAGGRLLFAGGGATNAAELYDPDGARSRFTGQGPARARSAARIPDGPLSLCGTSCGKVALIDNDSSFAAFGWQYSPRPAPAQISPASGPAAGATRVAITGTGLAGATRVRFGALEASALTPDPGSPDTRLLVTSPAHPAGTVPVTVTTPGGDSQFAQAAQFTFISAATGGGSGNGGAGPGAGGPGAGAGGGIHALPGTPASAIAAERRRARSLRRCLSRATRSGRRRLAHARSRGRAARSRARRHARRLRSRCRRRLGRTPGPVSGLAARPLSRTEILLTFTAPGSHGMRPPPARRYLLKQSSRPIRSRRGYRRARSLCGGYCRVAVSRVGVEIRLTVTGLRPRTTYHYVIAARDNVSGRRGPRSRAVRAKTP